MLRAFSRLPDAQRTLWMVRGISLLSAAVWLDYLVPTLLGSAGPVQAQVFVAVLMLLAASVLGAILPRAGGVLYVVGAIVLGVASVLTDGPTVTAVRLGVIPFGIGVVLLVYTERARTATRSPTRPA